MRICLIGSQSGKYLDEGMRIINHTYRQRLSKNHNVISLSPFFIINPGLFMQFKRFRPEIIHYTSGPTIASLLMLKFLSLIHPTSKTIVSATHPWFPFDTAKWIRFLAPDLVLYSSKYSKSYFSRYCQTTFFPNGVDTARFSPVDLNTKRMLRNQYGLEENVFIALHVGSIKEQRGIDILVSLTRPDWQILVVGSQSTGHSRKSIQRMKESGCLVLMKYLPRIHEIYALSDCYIFPVQKPLSAIEIPLSILEAMSCNLPVASYPFGGLPELISEGEGFYYCKTLEDFERRVQMIQRGVSSRTREKVLPFDWEKIIIDLEGIYSSLVDKDAKG